MNRSDRHERLRAAWHFTEPVDYSAAPPPLPPVDNGILYNEFDYHELAYRHVGDVAHLVLGGAAYGLGSDAGAAWSQLLHPRLVDIVADLLLTDLRAAIDRNEPSDNAHYQVHLSYPLGREQPDRTVEHRVLITMDADTRLPCCHREWIQVSVRRPERIELHALLSYHSSTSGQHELLRRCYQPPCIFDTALSQREQEIARGMARGLNSKDIAADLFLSKHTVDTYRRTILGKVGVENTTELILLAKKLGWGE